VPALPGAMNNLEQCLLCDNFQANECSLPPAPSKSMFMVFKDELVANIGKNVKDDEVNNEKNKMIYFER
jgi:hypothetical protein